RDQPVERQLEHVTDEHTYVRLRRVALREAGGEPAVDLDEIEAARARRELLGEGAQPRTDLADGPARGRAGPRAELARPTPGRPGFCGRSPAAASAAWASRRTPISWTRRRRTEARRRLPPRGRRSRRRRGAATRPARSSRRCPCTAPAGE